ncbi:MAG: tetratricopeptide repeat protein [Thermodesulfovibrionales bacterium]
MGKNKNKAVQPSLQSGLEVVPSVNLRMHLLFFAFLSAAVFLAYSNSLTGTWALDDTAIGQYASIEKSLDLRLGYRQVAYASFLINKWINPLDPVNYRTLNIAIHIVNSALVYWLAFITLRLPGMRERFSRYAYPVAVLSSLVFALHPVNINAVSYIVQRMASLAAMFSLLALISYIYGRTVASGIPAVSLYILSAVFVFMGIFSKENAVMAMPLIVLYDYFFIARFEQNGLCRKVVFAALGALLLLGAVSVFLNLHKVIGKMAGVLWNMNQPVPATGWTAVDVYWTPQQHILTEFRVIARYLSLLALPLPSRLVFDYWGYVPSANISTPWSTLFSMFAIVGVIVFAMVKRRTLTFISFGILWYFIAISLESFIAVGSDFYFEHRNYLPVTGLFFGVFAQMAISFKDILFRQKALWGVVLVLSAVLGGLTFQRNLVWKDSITLWTDTVNKAPQNLRASMALGNAYLKSADLASAGRRYAEILKQASTDKRPQFFHDAAYSLGMVNLFLGNLSEAKKIIDLMDARLAGDPSTGVLRGFLSSMAGDTANAIRQLNQSLSEVIGLDTVIVYTLLGDTYRRAGQQDKALESYKKALEQDPSFTAAHYGLGNVYFLLKQIDKAEAATSRALALDPVNPLALAQMADIVLIRKGPVEKARQFAERAVAASPPFYQPYASMGTVMVLLGNEADADVFFQKAAERGLRGYLLPYTRARAYFMKGDKEKASLYLQEILPMDDAPAELKNVIRKDLARL